MEVPEGIETREVLAGAYAIVKRGTMLNHAVHVDDKGLPTVVLCGRVRLENLSDRYGSDPKAMPTCKRCLQILRRLS